MQSVPMECLLKLLSRKVANIPPFRSSKLARCSLKGWALTGHIGPMLPAPMKMALTSVIFCDFLPQASRQTLVCPWETSSPAFIKPFEGSRPRIGLALQAPAAYTASINLNSQFLPRTLLIIKPDRLTIN